MRLKLKGQKGYDTRSTDERDIAHALVYAEAEYDRLQQRIKEGAPLHDWTFKAHWQDWYERKCRRGTWKAERKEWHEGYFERYFSPYFDKKVLNDMSVDFVDGYWDWRIDYWQTGEGATKRANDPSVRNSVLIPAKKTLQMEQGALREIFVDAHARKRIKYLPIIKITRDVGKQKRRPHFDEHEMNALGVNLRNYAKAVGRFARTDKQGKALKLNNMHTERRWQLYYYVQFLYNTGLRVGEARQMRWEDYKEFTDDDGERKLNIRVREDTKTGYRQVISQPNAVKYLKKWKKLSPATGAQDYVWIGIKKDADGKYTAATDFNKTFQTVLRAIPYKDRKDGLLNDIDGDRRSIYSLRHSYATTRLLRGEVKYEDLSRNMNAGIEQLKKHYDHVVTAQRSMQITQTTPKTKKNAKLKKLQDDLVAATDAGDAGLARATLNSILRMQKQKAKLAK